MVSPLNERAGLRKWHAKKKEKRKERKRKWHALVRIGHYILIVNEGFHVVL